MAGIPLTLGFIAKEAGYEALLDARARAAARSCSAWSSVGSMLTVAYSARFVLGALFGVADDRARRRRWRRRRRRRRAPHRLGFLGAAARARRRSPWCSGVAPGLLDGAGRRAARAALEPGLAPVPPGGLARAQPGARCCPALTIAGGVRASCVARRPGRPCWSRRTSSAPVGLRRSTSSLLRGAEPRGRPGHRRGAERLAAGLRRRHPARPPSTLPARRAARRPAAGPVRRWPAMPRRRGGHGARSWRSCSPRRSAAATIRRRFAAALLLGGVGYAMAGLFVVQGAPDLALTQVAVETLSTVLFVLVLRRLPDRFEQRVHRRRPRVPPGGRRRWSGSMVFVLRPGRGGRAPARGDVSSEMIERSLPDGHGRNVVNVILVDFRGLRHPGRDHRAGRRRRSARSPWPGPVRRPGRPPARADGGTG